MAQNHTLSAARPFDHSQSFAQLRHRACRNPHAKRWSLIGRQQGFDSEDAQPPAVDWTLAGSDTERQLRRDVQAATQACAQATTPYGPVIQQVRLDAPALQNWWYMTQQSPALREVMRSSTLDGRTLRLVVYIYFLVPGNPFGQERAGPS